MIQQAVIDKVLELRKNYQLGPIRISWYLSRYHEIEISGSSVYRILQRNNCSRLPKTASRGTVHTKRYQFTAIDDASRIRALKMFNRHNQNSAIEFIDYMIEKFPFRIYTIRTDRGHEFQARFHWYVEDKGIRHVYIKPKSPQLNGKVERSHRTDQEEFNQLLTYTDDVDLNTNWFLSLEDARQKNSIWQEEYNNFRPHSSLGDLTPNEFIEVKQKKLEISILNCS